ncbi:Ig-like domain repeat protein [Granulicella tundricola]|nr:Ig-like domain repeat protein [Granulicella tundricola]
MSSHAAVLLTAALLPAAAVSQVKPLITKKIDANSRASLTHSIPAPVSKATDLGRVSSNLPMKDMLLTLQPSDTQKASLEAFLGDVQNPSSLNFHKFLSPFDFGIAYGPAQADIDTVSAWLTSQGFQVEGIAASHTWIRFSGTAATVETAFGTQMHNYQADGVKRISNSTELTIPSALAPVVSSVLSLNNFEKRSFHTPVNSVTRNSAGKLMRAATTQAQPAVSNADGTVVPAFTSQSQPEQNLLAPGDFAKIYNTSSIVANGNNGTGVSIAIVGRSDISLSDVETFRTLFKLPYNDPTFINANADPGVVVGDDEEAILDVEWSGAVAPMAQIKYVIGGSTATTDGVDISAAYIVDNKIAPIMSLSFGECEQALAPAELLFYNNLWQQASAEGISVLVSAGDNGSSACLAQNTHFATSLGFGVSGLASTPYNTAVGGTEFNDPTPDTFWTPTINADQSSAKGYVPEYVWNETCNTAAPTTTSNCYFQQAASAPAFAGSGGASTCSTHGTSPSILTGLYACTSGYAKPSWQTGLGVPADSQRDVPDVSLAAAGGHDGFLLCYNGSCQYTTNSDGSFSLTQASVIGGTSASAPSMAGILALVEQKNGQYQGLANYKLYALANAQTSTCNSSTQTDPTQSSACVFHDITEGSNTMTCTGTTAGCTVAVPGTTTYKQLSGWAATPGYDLATGLGTINAANLVSAWGNISQTATTTSLTLSSTTITHGSPVIVASTVTPASGTGTPSGSLLLVATGTTSTPGPVLASALTAGALNASVSSLPGGTYALTAQYGGDAAFTASTSSAVNVTIAPESSAMTVATLVKSRFFVLGRQPIVSGTSVGLDANWFISIGMAGKSGAGIPTGSVNITQGTSVIGSFPLDKTGAIYITCGPYTSCDYPIGTYTFTATYSGDSSFSAITQTFPFAITKGTANYSVSADRQIVTTGTPVTATVYIGYDPAVLPTGTVSLYRDDTKAVLGTGTINASGNAVITFNAPVGSYGADASWTGDTNYTAGIASSYPDMTVTAPAGIVTTSALKVSAATSSLGKQTSFAVSITPASKDSSGAVPTGTVTLYSKEEGQISAAVPVTGSAVTLFVQWPIAGTETVYAVYSGDTKYSTSTSALSAVAVSQATPSLSLTTLAPYVAVGGRDSITAVLTSAVSSTSAQTPTGTIQFFDALNGAASTTLGTPQAINGGNGGVILSTLAPVLASGSHVITAVYSGDTNWTTATSTTSVTIVSTTANFIFTGPKGLTITAGQSGTLALSTSSILGFSTPAAITCGGTLPEGFSCGTSTITPGTAGTLAVTSTAPGTVIAAFINGHDVLPWKVPGAVTLAGLALFLMPRRRRFTSLVALLLAASFAVLNLSGCGGAGTPATSQLSITSTNTKVASGSPAVFNALVSGGSNPTGTITFSDAGTVIGTSPVTNGVALFSTSTLSVGTHAITASYAGDNNNAASKSSDTLNQTVTGTFSLTVNATAGAVIHTTTVPVTLQ